MSRPDLLAPAAVIRDACRTTEVIGWTPVNSKSG